MSLSKKLVELAENGFQVSIRYEPRDESYILSVSRSYYQPAYAQVYRNIFINSGDGISCSDHTDHDFDSVFLEALNMAEKTWNDFYKRGET